MSDRILSALKAAHHLGTTPELLTTNTLLNIPLQRAFIVGEVEASRDSTGDPEIGGVQELLRSCCSTDLRYRAMGEGGLTRARVRELMMNFDDGAMDELYLFRPQSDENGE